MANRDERNEYATAKWDAEEVRRQAASEQHRRSSGGVQPPFRRVQRR